MQEIILALLALQASQDGLLELRKWVRMQEVGVEESEQVTKVGFAPEQGMHVELVTFMYATEWQVRSSVRLVHEEAKGLQESQFPEI